MRLSVLDLSPIASGETATDALHHTIDLARHAEELGAARYWLAEYPFGYREARHHNAGSLASSAPEIMIGQVGAVTKTLRVGSGGIMLPNHAPLKVAELFRVLGALFPGRIDLGLGRAAGTDPKTAAALRGARGATGDDFPRQMSELVAYLDEDGPPRAPFSGGIRAIPSHVAPPELWILGSSDYGGAYAAAHGLPFAFAQHINPRDAEAVLRAYRREFRPSARCAAPRSMLALSVIVAERDSDARELEHAAAIGFLQFAKGMRDEPMPSVAEAKAYVTDADDEALLAGQGRRAIVGTVDRVRAELGELVRRCEVDEVMALTHVHEQAARKRSYALLADALA